MIKLRSIHLLAGLILVAMLGACATGGRSKADILDDTIRAYSQALRWEAPERLEIFQDPDIESDDDLPLRRFKQFMVKGVRPQGAPVIDSEKNTATQSVIIELINRHTQSPKAVVEEQKWRYFEGAWLLTSGFPKLDREVELDEQ